jgi:hypothetical protein
MPYLLLGIYMKRCKSKYKKESCTPMFIVALCTIARLLSQARYPTTNNYLKKIWYIYTMEHYPTTKKNDITSIVGK